MAKEPEGAGKALTAGPHNFKLKLETNAIPKPKRHKEEERVRPFPSSLLLKNENKLERATVLYESGTLNSPDTR